VLPFLLIVLFSIFEAAWTVTTQMLLSHAVFEGARCAIRAREWEGEDPASLAKRATREAFWMGNLADADVAVQVLPADEVAPRRVEVAVPAYAYAPLTGFLPSGLLPERLGAKAVMAFP